MRDLARLDRRIQGTVVLVGVGCEGRGDDAAGSVLARRLRGRIAASVIDAGDRPEDVTDRIAQAQADTVIIADAVEMQARPGDVAVLDVDCVRETGCDTHRASLATLMRYLELRTRATVLLLAIQPGSLGETGALSEPVCAAIVRLETLFGARGRGAPVPAGAQQGGAPWTSSSGS